MKGTAILDTMARQVDEVYADNVRAARESSEGILDETRQERAALEKETLAATAAEMEALAERWRKKADAEAAKAALVVQSDSVCAVLAKIGEEIRTIVDSDDFPEILEALLLELMAAAPAGVVAHAPPAYVDRVRDWLANNGHRDVSVEGASNMWDGVAIQDPERTFRISNTLTGRFARVEQEARKRCMMSLFGKQISEEQD